MGRYNRRLRKYVQQIYLVASIVWVFGCLLLRVTKAKSFIAYGILAVPLFVYSLGYLKSHKITHKSEKTMLMTDFLAIALLLITILLEMYHHNADHYTVNIMIVAFIILMISTIDFPVGECNLTLVRHIKSIMRTAAITLLTYVIFVNVTNRVAMKLPISNIVSSTN